MTIELKLDAAMQEAIILGAVQAMTTGPYIEVNAMRREGDDVIVFFDTSRASQQRQAPQRLRRALAWAFPHWFSVEAS